jgi:hypothetical protein
MALRLYWQKLIVFLLEILMASLEKHPTLPIVMRTYDSSLVFGSGDMRMTLEDEAMINAQPTLTYYLLDMREVTLSFEEIMKASSIAAGQSKTFTNPNVIENLIIVPNRLVELSAEGLRSPVYGSLKIKPFRTVEDAVAYVEQQLKNK